MKNCFLSSILTTFLATVLSAQEMPKPTAEHQKLAASVGTWDAVIEMTGEDGKPQTSKGVSEVKAGPGGFFVIDDFNATLMGGPFVGHGVTGWDAAKGKCIGTWVDSMSGHMMVLEGTLSADGKTLTMTGSGPGPTGEMVAHRMVTTTKDANTRVFEMFVPGPEGKEMKVLTITYTRRAPKAGGPADRVK